MVMLVFALSSSISEILQILNQPSMASIFIESIFITTISDVDGVASTQVRLTVIPNSKDIAPVRNQLLKIDLTNTTVTGQVDTVAVGDGSAGGTYTTNTSYSTPSGY